MHAVLALFTITASRPAWAEDAAQAPSWSPLRVALECQSAYRVDACTLLRGAITEQKVLRSVPRSEADVTLFVNVTGAGNDDRVYLRVTSERDGALPLFEQFAVINSRQTVEEQRAALQPLLARALAPALLVVNPQAVRISLVVPTATEAPSATRAYGFSVWAGAWTSWTEDYQYRNYWTGANLRQVKADRSGYLSTSFDRNVERQPSLRINGEEVSLSSDGYEASGQSLYERNLGERWAVGGMLRAGLTDPEGAYARAARAHVGADYNWFPSDDPRGNRAALTYLLGGMYNDYNQINVLGEETALLPTHLLIAGGNVKVDRMELNLDLGLGAELLHPSRRYEAYGSVGMDWRIGDHVDLRFNVSALQQAIPGPATIDLTNFEEVRRASYAQPLQLDGNFNLHLHWDPTNGVQNNRFENVEWLGGTSTF